MVDGFLKKVQKQFIVEKIVCSTNGAGTINWIPICNKKMNFNL